MEIWSSVNIYGLGGYRNLSITITREMKEAVYMPKSAYNIT
jgi:hypothetical protein